MTDFAKIVKELKSGEIAYLGQVSTDSAKQLADKATHKIGYLVLPILLDKTTQTYGLEVW